MKAHIRLTLDVIYETNGVAVADLKDMVWAIAHEASAAGQMTCNTPAEVHECNATVEYLP